MKTGYSGWPLHMCAQEIWSREHQVLPNQSNGGTICAVCGGVRVHKLNCEHYKNKVTPAEDPVWGAMLTAKVKPTN